MNTILRLYILTVACLLTVHCRLAPEKGSCPPSIPVDTIAECGTEKPCNSTQLCCPTASGGSMCVDPVTKRHFVNLVKKGKCPEHPGGVWACSDRCTVDSDCPRILKCCRNRCGALACQKPETDDEPAGPNTV